MRFFLDNNLSPRYATALSDLFDCSVTHLSSKFPRSTPDEEWLPALSSEGDWVVVSGDRRIYKSPHLRQVWIASKLTTFFLGSGWLHQRLDEQAWWLVRWWPKIVTQAEQIQPGTGFQIPAKPSGKFKLLSPSP